MEDSFFQKYSEKHVHFYDEEVSVLVQSGAILTRKSAEKPRIVDLGCGDGRLIFALYERGLLNDADEILGVDISQSRIERLREELPFVKGVISDALNVEELRGSSFDYVICSQLIEHVEDDELLMLEVNRLLKAGGLAYLSSVIRKEFGVYFYFRDGSFRLDPTHVREYSSADEFLGLIVNNGFEVVSVRTEQIMFPILDLFMRLLVRVGLAKGDVKFYRQHRTLGRIRRLRIPVIGYMGIEVLAKKNVQANNSGR